MLSANEILEILKKKNFSEFEIPVEKNNSFHVSFHDDSMECFLMRNGITQVECPLNLKQKQILFHDIRNLISQKSITLNVFNQFTLVSSFDDLKIYSGIFAFYGKNGYIQCHQFVSGSNRIFMFSENCTDEIIFFSTSKEFGNIFFHKYYVLLSLLL